MTPRNKRAYVLFTKVGHMPTDTEMATMLKTASVKMVKAMIMMVMIMMAMAMAMAMAMVMIVKDER